VLTDPGSGVFVVWAGAARDAVVAGAELVVLEPDGRHLEAIGWSEGDARWRIELAAPGTGRLYGLGDRVVLHDRDQATVVEAARGRILGRHPAPIDGLGAGAHGLVERRGACAWVGPCGIQAFDCRDGAPLGDYFPSIAVHFQGLMGEDPGDEGPSCATFAQLVGRHEDTLVVIADTPQSNTREDSAPTLVGLDAAEGQPRWHVPLHSSSTPAGMSDDGGCWTLDTEAPRLRVFECESGSLRWDRALGPGRLVAHGVGDTILIARHHGDRWRLSAYASANGRPAWSTRLSRRQHPLLPLHPIPDALLTGRRRVYALLDPTRRGVVGEVVASRDQKLWRDPEGGFVLIGRELRELDAEGRLIRQRPFTGMQAKVVSAGHVLTDDGETIEIYDREQVRERARVEGRLSIESTAELPKGRLLLRRYGEDGVALVLGLQEPQRGAGRR